MSASPEIRGSIALGGLTPLLDTLFVLLFALLAASDARREQNSADVLLRLPEVAPDGASADAGPRRVVLTVDQDSKVHLEDGSVPLENGPALDAALADHLGGSLPEEVAIEIRADREAHYGIAVELLQHLRLRGFVDVLLSASGSAEPGAGFGGETE